MPALDVIRHLFALQGQVSNAPYVALWTRVQALQRDELTGLLESRKVVRASSLRGTLHIIAAEDYLQFHPLLVPTLSRNLHLFASRTAGFAMDSFIGAMRAYIREQPRTKAELQVKMDKLYHGMGKMQIADAVRMYLALIQIPSAGTWGFTGKPAHVEATAWLGQPLASSSDYGRQQLILRYLAAFGPASVQDIQKWSGLTRLQSTIAALRPELLTFRDEQGRELFDLPHAPRPSADTPAPVRFLSAFDNLLLAYNEQGRILADEYYSFVFSNNGLLAATFLVDGFVRGMWKIERQSTITTLLIHPFEPLPPQIQSELRQEGERLMRFALDAAQPFEIQFVSQENNVFV